MVFLFAAEVVILSAFLQASLAGGARAQKQMFRQV